MNLQAFSLQAPQMPFHVWREVVQTQSDVGEAGAGQDKVMHVFCAPISVNIRTQVQMPEGGVSGESRAQSLTGVI